MGVDAGVLEAVGIAASVAGTAVSAVGAINQAQSQQKAAEYQSQVAANNAQLAQQSAQQATAAGEAQVEQEGLKQRAQVGAIKAAQAASNVDVNSGSAVDVRSSAEELGQLNALTIRSNAEKTAYGYETQATSDQGQASLYQSAAANAPVAGAINATSSILGGASGAANQYLAWQRYTGSGSGSSGGGYADNTSPIFQ